MKKKYLLLITFFLVSLFWCLIVQPLSLDEVWDYGFAHGIYSGLTPYKDFNMILPVFYPFVMSLGFYVFGSSALVFHIENAIILTVLLFLISKLTEKNYMLIALFFFLPFNIAFPSYNMFSFFLLVILLLMEKNEANDYLIGIIIGLAIITKHTVGFFYILPSLYYYRQPSKIIKRICGMLVPIVAFIIYLICSKSLYYFWDLCFMGLFDFAGENHPSICFGHFAFIAFLIIDIFIVFKNKKNVLNYYLLSFITMMIPLFDLYHCQLTFLSVLLLIYINYDIRNMFNQKLLFFGIIVGVSFISLIKYPTEIIYPNNINHFEYRLLDSESIDFTNEILDFIKKNNYKKIIYLNSNSYYIKIVSDKPIKYYDLINKGNWGYNGSKKLLNKIKKEKNAVFVVDTRYLEEANQTDLEAIYYVVKNGKKIGNIRMYDVYDFEENKDIDSK